MLILFSGNIAYAQETFGTKWEDIKTELQGFNVFNADVKAKDPTLGVPKAVGRALNAVFALVASIALIVFVYAGFTWMWSIGRGASESASNAQRVIVYASAGLAIIFGSYFLTQYILKVLYPQ